VELNSVSLAQVTNLFGEIRAKSQIWKCLTSENEQKSFSRETKQGTALFTLSIGVICVWVLAQWFWNADHAYNGHNGDHFYYTAYAHMFNGVPYRRALELSAQYFNYQRPSAVLDYEWIDIAIAPLVYPRTFLSIMMAASIKIFGENGVWFPTLIFGFLTHFLWWRLLLKRFSHRHVGIVMLVISLSPQFTELRFGLYTESPLLFLLTLWCCFVVRAFRPDQPAQTSQFIPLVLLVPLIALTRQSLLIPLAIFVVIAIQHSISGYKHIGKSICLVAYMIIVQWIMQKWAPYDPTVFAMEQNGATSSLDLISQIPTNAIRIFLLECSRLASFKTTADPVYFVLILATPLLLFKFCNWRRCISLIAVLLICLATTYLNGRATGFRYLVPVIPVAVVTLTMGRGISIRSSNFNTLDRTVTAFLFLLSMYVVVLTANYSVQRAEISQWKPVSSITFTEGWPLKIPEGFLGCAGDDFQIWFKTPDGELYAASGPALHRRFFTKSVDEISINERSELISPTLNLMRYGMRLCGGEYMVENVPDRNASGNS
jgi:hypothetical protein